MSERAALKSTQQLRMPARMHRSRQPPGPWRALAACDAPPPSVLLLPAAACLLRPPEANRVSITDLNSTNGTLVNGQELTPMDDVELGVGSEVIFGEGRARSRCLAACSWGQGRLGHGWLRQARGQARHTDCCCCFHCPPAPGRPAWRPGDMFLARFQLDEVPDQQADVGAMAQQLSDQLSQHPNNNATGG